MPILKPEIAKALRAAGLSKDQQDSSLDDKLNACGLSLEETLSQLSDIAHAGGNETVRLRALETSLKLSKVLNDQPSAIPNITIVINDPNRPPGVNPILIPRETKQSVEKDLVN